MAGFPLLQFAATLSSEVGRFVIDRTGLGGTFELQLTYARPQTGVVSTTATDPDLFTPIQEQPGLRLEASRGPVDVLVIESIDPCGRASDCAATAAPAEREPDTPLETG